MELALIVSLLFALVADVAGNTSGSQRFQADSFLDMLGRTFDQKTAYVDLLSALTSRLNIDISNPHGNSTSDKKKWKSLASDILCPEADKRNGASVTYTSDTHNVGTRAFYQCETGYDGMSKFIHCEHGGHWSSLADWEGCTAVDCGIVVPHVRHAEPSYTTTTYGSHVLYTCNGGYKMDSPNANVTCLDTGLWQKPTFGCEKANTPPLRLPSLQKAFNKNIGVQKIQQLQQLATTLLDAGPSPSAKSNQPAPLATSFGGNQLMAALLKNMPGFQNLSLPKTSGAKSSSTNSNNFANNPMAAMFAQMFQNFSPPPAPPPAPPQTTTTPKPAVKAPGGFQLPSHLKSLLPNGLANAAGFRPQDLMTLATMGLGSSNSAAAPRDITQLLGAMNPMSMLGGGMGMGLGLGLAGGLGGQGAKTGAGPGAAPPIEPEKVAEQQQDMMMRAMMASMMNSGGSRNGTSRNPAMEMMTLMALQNGLSGGGSGGGGGAGGGGGGMDPLGMMFGGMGGGSSGGGGLFGGLFGGAK